jgi:glycosyltransferase involved in cell wall biosynthesis
VGDPPTIDVIIPAANAAGWIGQAIEAVKSQGYPGLGTIVVASLDDDTADVARSHGAVVVPNPTGRTPTGLNLALAATSAEFVARVDAHSVIPPGYLERAVAILVETNADNVGGMQLPAGDRLWEKAIAAAMSSPLGAGDARYRIGGDAGPADTVYLGVFRRSTLERLGGFDESFERNQDFELNHRIRETGGVVWFDPELRVVYRPRGSLRQLARQYFQYGRWKRYFSRRHPRSLRWRQLAPPLLVVILAITLAAGFWWRPAWIVAGGYLVTLLAGAVAQIPRFGFSALGMVPALAIMHFCWGLGFLSSRAGLRRTT